MSHGLVAKHLHVHIERGKQSISTQIRYDRRVNSAESFLLGFLTRVNQVRCEVFDTMSGNTEKASGDKQYLDEYDDYNIDQDKFVSSSHSGKGRSKKEAEQHHREDPNGHTRKNVQKLMNNAANNKK